MKRASLLVGDRVGEALPLYHTNLVNFSCLRRNNRTMKKRYISMSSIPSKEEYNILKDQPYNLHEINKLQTALEKTPFLPQEGRLLHARRACSRMLKGLFFELEEHVWDKKGAK